MRYLIVVMLLSLSICTAQAASIYVPTDYTTIQAAISAAAPDDTIIVSAGTYVESGQIGITKNLTIIGAGADSTIIKPADNTTGSDYGTPGAWIYVGAGASLTLEGFTLDGRGKLINHAIRSYGSLAVYDCTIKNIGYSIYAGRAIVLFDGADNVIDGCNFSDIRRIGVHVRGNVVSGSNPTAAITGCTYIGKGVGDWLDYAFEVGGGGHAVITGCMVSNCLGVASVDNSGSAGILATDYWGTGTEATITGCTITNCSDGIHVGYASNDATVVTANSNNLTGNWDFGIDQSGLALVDGASNWWGKVNGPGPVGPGMGDNVSENIDFSSWLSKPANDDVVYLVPTDASIYVQPTETVVVDMNVANLTQPVSALQAFLNFSSTYFSTGSLNVAAGGGVWNELIYNTWNTGGDLDVAVGVDLDVPGGTQADETAAIITLHPITEGVTRIVFRPDADPDYGMVGTTMFSTSDGSPEYILPAKVNSTNIYIDGTAPTIATAPADGSSNTVTSATQEITGTVSDAISGVDTLTYTLNSGSSVSVAVTEGEFSQSVVLLPGNNTVEFTVTDRAGNSATSTINYTYNQPAPAIDVYASLAPNKYAGASSWSAWQANAVSGALDKSSSVGSGYAKFEDLGWATQDFSSCVVTNFNSWLAQIITGSEWGTATEYVYRIDNGVQSNPGAAKLSLDYVELTHLYVYKGVDGSSGDQTLDFSSFAQDTIDSGSFLAGNQKLKGYDWDGDAWVEVTSGRSADVIICVWDRLGQDPQTGTSEQDKLNNLYKELSGALVNPDTTPNRTQFYGGNYEVLYTGHSYVGEGDSGLKEIKFAPLNDGTKPVIAISAPDDGSVTNSPSCTITGSAADNEDLASGIREVEILLNGSQIYLNTTQDNVSFSQGGTLVEGNNTIEVRAKDFADNSDSETIDVLLDTINPLISIDSAKQSGNELIGTGVNALQGTVDIYVTATDESSGLSGNPTVTVTPNGGSAESAAYVDKSKDVYHYTWTVSSTTPNGLASISAGVTDNAGNPGTAVTKQFNVNKNRITGSVELQSFAGGTRTVTFVANGGLKTWSIPVACAGATGSYTLTDVPDGVTALSAKADWNLRVKLTIDEGSNGQQTADFTGANKLLGGDINGSNSINVIDYSVLKANWFTSNSVADITGDGVVNNTDYIIMKTNWFKTGSQP